MHQGDRDGAKGVYPINVVNEVTQYEYIGAVSCAASSATSTSHSASRPGVDAFAREHLSPYLNYHRPCLFATEREGANGRIMRVYRPQDVQTPYAKLRSLADAEACPKPGVCFADLDAQAHAMSDPQAVRVVNAARDRLFHSIAGASDQRLILSLEYAAMGRLGEWVSEARAVAVHLDVKAGAGTLAPSSSPGVAGRTRLMDRRRSLLRADCSRALPLPPAA